MIGFVTWAPLPYQNYYKGGQVTKRIMLVKTCQTIMVLQKSKCFVIVIMPVVHNIVA